MDRVQGLKSEPCINKSCLSHINQWGTRTALAGNLLSNPQRLLWQHRYLCQFHRPLMTDSLLFCLTKRSQSGCLRDSKEQNPVPTSTIKVYHTQWPPWWRVIKYPNASVLLTNDLSCLPQGRHWCIPSAKRARLTRSLSLRDWQGNGDLIGNS